MKNHFIYLLIGVTLLSCNTKPKTSSQKKDIQHTAYTPLMMKPVSGADTTIDMDVDATENDYAFYDIIVADTGTNYQQLQRQMLALKDKLQVDIDTMDRYYDSKQKKIILPKTDSDEIYAGEYFPRRIVSSTLSIEYLNQYKKDAKPKTLAIISGIFDDAKLADSALSAAKKCSANAFKMNTKLYVGCMH